MFHAQRTSLPTQVDEIPENLQSGLADFSGWNIDETEFELGRDTSGSLHLEPSHHVNDDVELEPDGGVVEWDISC